MSWAHGTSGLADTCTPSRAADAASAVPYVADLLARGYVVAAADYEGLGTPGPHPYLVGPSEGRSVLDAARAARHIDGAGAGRTVVVAGHSEGGQAAVFAGELARRYAPDLDVRGAAALAPAEADRLLSTTETRPDVQGLVAMAAEGLRAAFPKADVDAVLTPGAITTLRELDGTACVFATLAGFRDRGITALPRRSEFGTVGAGRAASERPRPDADDRAARGLPGRAGPAGAPGCHGRHRRPHVRARGPRHRARVPRRGPRRRAGSGGAGPAPVARRPGRRRTGAVDLPWLSARFDHVTDAELAVVEQLRA